MSSVAEKTPPAVSNEMLLTSMIVFATRLARDDDVFSPAVYLVVYV